MGGHLIPVVLATICCLVPGVLHAGDYDFPGYAEMRERLGELYQNGEYAKAAELMEWSVGEYPDHLMANSYNLALMYCRLERVDDAIDVLLAALDHEVWFHGHAFANEAWEPVTRHERFAEIEAVNDELRQKAQEQAELEVTVVTPESYDPERTYPLFIALHGGNGNKTEFKNIWTSERMSGEFIVAYAQSSQVESMTGFGWTDSPETARRDITQAYRDLVAEYPVDEDEVIVGGFSSGGVASLDVALSGTIQVVGFVALCPGRPESFSDQALAEAATRGLRGSVLTTEMDPRLPEQREMVEAMEKAGLRHRFVITPDVGHWIPDDLGAQLDSSIDFILSTD